MPPKFGPSRPMAGLSVAWRAFWTAIRFTRRLKKRAHWRRRHVGILNYDLSSSPCDIHECILNYDPSSSPCEIQFLMLRFIAYCTEKPYKFALCHYDLVSHRSYPSGSFGAYLDSLEGRMRESALEGILEGIEAFEL